MNVPQKTRKARGIVSLLACVVAIGFVWLWLLPWVSVQPRMKSTLDRLEQQKIDPSAMFYTDLDAMDDILQERRSRERRKQMNAAN